MNKNKGLKLYYIENNFINYLKQFDNRIMYNKNGNRPYVGVVLEVEGINFFAPLKSARENTHANARLTTKILDETNTSERKVISYIIHQDMIPIPNNSVLINADPLNNLDNDSFKFVLIKELMFFRIHKDRILKKANQVYGYSKIGKPSFLANQCLNFDDLCKECKNYDPKKTY